MKNLLFLLFTLVFVTGVFMQHANADVTVTVTNPTFTTPNLAPSYASLANAITALNTITAISGGFVALTCASSGTETAPAGGYVINFTATTTASNYVIINGNGSTITASPSLTGGNLNDAIFKIIGSDFVTLKGFTMIENASNTTTNPATNNMTEWGVALLYASLTNGAQNNTIQNNNISLNRTYFNTFGIYSNTRHSATAVTTTSEVTSAAGSNSGNKVYGNSISNVNFGIVFIGAGTAIGAIDNGNDIGGSSAATGNNITNWGGGSALSGYVSLTASNYCIFDNQQINDNISYNTITSASGLATAAVTLGGILKDYTVGQPIGIITTTINNNSVTLSNAPTTGSMIGINNQGLTLALSTATMSINNNTILNCAITGAGATAATMAAITNSSVPGILNMNNNIIRGNTSTATTGGFTGISNSGAVVTTCNINNNQVGNGSGGAITLSAITTGSVAGISNTAGAATCALSISGNNFQGFTYGTTSTGTFQCINTIAVVLTETINTNNFNNLTIKASGAVAAGILIGATNATPTVTISGNYITTQFSNTSTLAGNFRLIANANGAPTTGSTIISGNNISNVTYTAPSGSAVPIIWESGSTATCSHNITVDGNTVSNIKNLGTNTLNTISLFGIRVGLGNNNVISNNNINLLENGAGSTFGIITGATSTNTSGGTYNINNNIIRDIKCTSIFTTAVGQAIGMQLQTANLGVTNVFKNKIYDINSVVTSGYGGGVAGIVLLEGNASHVANVYNNYIGRLYSPTPYYINAIRGIVNANSAANTTNFYYNTIYLDGNNSLASYCYYSQAATPISNLRNNIFINNCVATGTWEQMVYFIFGTLPATYLTTSNNNLLYCGTPGPLNLIYADGTATVLTNKQQTLAAFKAYVGPIRESLSVTENVTFLNTSTGSGSDYLHINAAVPTQVESGAVNIATYTDDYDGVIRQGNPGYSGTGTAPDIGADEGEFIFPIPMVYVSSTTTQNTANTAPNLINQQIIGIQVVTSGTVTPITITSFAVNANGTTNVADITNAHIYYTGNTPTFSATGLFGSFAAPTLANFNITGSQVLFPGTNYFWLTFDITPGATISDIVDAQCTQVVGSGTMGTQIPTVTAPAGARTIMGPMSGDYTVGLTKFNKAMGTNITFQKVVKKVMKEIKEVTVEKPLAQNSVLKGKSAISANTSDLKNNQLGITTAGDEVLGIQQLESPLLSTEQVTSMGKWIEVEEVSWVPMENGVVYNGPLSAVTSGNSPNAPLAGVYATITAAVADLNMRGVSGPVRFLLDDASYTTGETFPIIVNVININVPTVLKTVTIKPNTGVTSSISGASSGAEIFRIYNTNYITIDGSNTTDGTTRDLTITNSSATSPEVIDINSTGTTPVTGAGVKNCTIINGSTNSTAIVLSDVTGSAGYFNNISIQNNSIQKAYIGIYNLAAVSAGNGNGLNITGNDLNASGTNSLRLIGIYVQGFDGATISNNNIGNMANTSDASNITGIWFATGTINSTISGNTISNISGTASAPSGIIISSAVANANVNVTGNTISGLTSSSTGTTIGMLLAGATSGVTVQKNKISNIKNTNTGGWGCNGIDLASTLTAANIKLANNVIYDVAAYGYTGGGVADNGNGIVVESGAGYNIYYNSISMNTDQLDPGYPAAINVLSGVTAAGAINLINNIFANSQTIGTERYAIYCGAVYTVFSSIGYNDYTTTGANLGFMTTASVLDLAAWKLATGQDAHSISDDPLFTSSVNLLPLPTSPVIGAALSLPGIVDFDINGTPRSVTAPTIGAYEAFANKTLSLKLYLEGLYNTGTGLMKQAQGLAGPQFGTDIADKVTVELHEITPPYGISTLYPPFTNADLKTNGTVTINTIPGTITGSYYVVIKHRNSIETWSKLGGITFGGSSPINYDFTTAVTQAFGNDPINDPSMKLMGGVYAIWSGDANQDGIVDGSDMVMIDNASLPPGLHGYNPQDLNGDGIVDGSDMALIDNNSKPPARHVQKP